MKPVIKYLIILIFVVISSEAFCGTIQQGTENDIFSEKGRALINPKATKETKALYQFLQDHFGRKTISGVMTIRSLEDISGEHQNEIYWLEERTGKRPAVLGLDFMDELDEVQNNPRVVEDAIDWYNQNGIPVFCWHWRDPSRKTRQFYSPAINKEYQTDFDVSKIDDESSPEYKAMLKDIDQIAGCLKKLQEANVPIIWRPLHEASGGWFWWGYKGAEPCKKLWKIMYDRMVNDFQLNNLIWVWTSDAKEDALNWYPGDEYVDIIGMDLYDKDHSHESQIENFRTMKEYFGNDRIIALSECGSIPTAEAMQKDHANWSWFMPWYGYYTKDPAPNPVEVWKELLDNEYIITLDEMPDLKNYQSVVYQGEKVLVDQLATKETVALFHNLDQLSQKHILFGHQDATQYGHSWKGDSNRSDVRDVCGSHPAVIGVDFGGLSTLNKKPVEEAKKSLHKTITETYARGGVVTICWHANNPVNDGSFYWDKDPVKAVSEIIPGGKFHQKYKDILKNIADVAHQAKGAKNELIPIIFRPFHEFDGDWFWWGKAHCTKEEFIELWRFTVDYLKHDLQVHNFLYAFSPDCKFTTEAEYLERYPGDAYVDLLGVDDYWDFRADGANDPSLGEKKLMIVSDLAQKKGKLAAFTETGLESVKDTTWYTSQLLRILKNERIRMAYVMVWRNAHDMPDHYYAPFPGHPAEKDFIKFYDDDYTWFESDLPDLYVK